MSSGEGWPWEQIRMEDERLVQCPMPMEVPVLVQLQVIERLFEGW